MLVSQQSVQTGSVSVYLRNSEKGSLPAILYNTSLLVQLLRYKVEGSTDEHGIFYTTF